MAPAHPDHCRRGINAGQGVALLNEVTRDWFARTTSQVENRPIGRNQLNKPIEPRLLIEQRAAVACPIPSVAVVKVNDSLSIGCHAKIVRLTRAAQLRGD